MTRDEALKALRECPKCRRWITTPTCDHCWVDNHRCPPTPAEAARALARAATLGDEAKRLQAELKRIGVHER
jgi:hypothetical protein